MLDLVGVQKVGWGGSGTEPKYTHFSMERGVRYRYSFLFVHKRIISAVKRVEFVSERMSYIQLRGHWCHIIVLNIHAPTEDKIDYVKDNFCEGLERVFDKFSNTT
jgi:hypothetical protein